jgi:Phage integrase, N-terminal SAM-like domain
VPTLTTQQIDSITLRQFATFVTHPIEALEAKHVQAWVDTLIDPNGETGLSVKTVNRKLSEFRN